MAITLTQSTTSAYSSSLSLAFGSNNIAGNFLIAIANINATAAFTCADTLGNSWILLNTLTGSTSNSANFAIFYCVSCLAGANTVTVGGTGASTEHTSFTIAEFNGVNSSDQAGTPLLGGSTSTVWTTNPITTNYSEELLVGLACVEGTGGVTVSAPFNVLGTNESFFSAFYQIVTSVQSAVTATGTMSSRPANSWSCSLSSFFSSPPELSLMGCGPS